MGKLNTMHINVTADIETVYLSNYVTPVTYMVVVLNVHLDSLKTETMYIFYFAIFRHSVPATARSSASYTSGR